MKTYINKVLNRFGYQIKRKDSGFSFNTNLDWLKKYDIKTIFDIGANEGQFAKYINSYFPGCIIYSFEPIKKCFLKLVELKKEIDGLTPFNYALGDSSGFIDFNINDFTPSSSILKMDEEHIRNFPGTKKTVSEKVELKKLDEISADLKIDREVLVKIDVQGYEDKVIAGGEKFFKEVPKIVIFESSIVKLYQDEVSFEDLFDKFRSMGYKYKGNMNQLYSPIDGSILQVDTVFIKSG